MRTKLIVILTCSCLLATVALIAQDIPHDELHWGSRAYVPEVAGTSRIRVQSDLVEVPTVVRDGKGNPVSNLKKEDFILSDNGKPQTISTFSILTGAGSGVAAAPEALEAPLAVQPRYVALYFDDVNTGFGRLNAAREAAIKFVHRGLNPGERVGIFTNSDSLHLDFTDDIQKLLDTLAKLQVLQRLPDQAMGACPPLNPYQAWVILHGGQNADTRNPHDDSPYGMAIRAASRCGCKNQESSCVLKEAQLLVGNAQGRSTDTFDSMIHAIRHLGDMPGRRILVLTSSGFLTLSLQQEQQKVIEAALRASVVINSLDAVGLPAFSDLWNTHYNLSFPMADMAAGTGGEFIHNNNDLAGGFAALSAVPRVSYILGFAPADLKIDGSEHKLKVQLTAAAHMTVSARPGYYAPSPELSASEKRFRKLEQSVMAVDDPAEIPIEFSATPETLKSGELSLKVLVHVDTRKLPFQLLSERHTERLIFITALFDTKNQFLTGVQGVMDLRLKDGTLKQISAQGLDAKLSIQAPAGSYRVREVVQESVNGHISAISRDVTIR